jgi:hypothetical protein
MAGRCGVRSCEHCGSSAEVCHSEIYDAWVCLSCYERPAVVVGRLDAGQIARLARHPWLDFGELDRALARLAPPDRLRAFYLLPAEVREQCWSRLRTQVEFDRLEAWLAPPPPRHSPRQRRAPRRQSDLPTIPAEYVARLAGVEVPASGNIRCPLPDHDDATASFHCFEERGWHCQGCQRGGNIYDLAALLWGVPKDDPRSFRKLHRRLVRELQTTVGSSVEVPDA